MDTQRNRPGHNLATAFLVAFALAVGLGACGGGENAESGAESEPRAEDMNPPAPAADAPAASVRILSPADGAVIDGSEVEVTLAAEGVIILPAGDTTPGSGHHHLYLDEDLTDPNQPVPSIPGRIVHLGDGSSSYVFEGVEPGEHRLIAAVADLAHIPLMPLVVDTVHFTVR